ncbi:unnamed protein product [Rhizoctonia solani]|uniref:UBC core domain-containing protein n=1 Tax=Rhizoctonia solani TaxID=456999 RepID=A0A8H3AUN5_9AGAM|nr:unnamed protein product [Rhizoctonia solani]
MASKPAHKRLSKEFMAMQRSPPPFVWASPEEKNILHWNFIVVRLIVDPRGYLCIFCDSEGLLTARMLAVNTTALSRFPRTIPSSPLASRYGTTHIPSRHLSFCTLDVHAIGPLPTRQENMFQVTCLFLNWIAYVSNPGFVSSMSDFHPGTWNPAWSVATICTGLLSFMLSDEMTTGSVTSTDAEKRDFALRSHEWNRKQKRFRDAFPDYCGEEMKDLPNMGEQDRGAAEESTAEEAPANPSNLAPAVRSSAPTVAKARTAPTPGAASAVVGQAVAPASWRETIWERWRWGIFILLAVLVSRLSNV